MSAFWEKVYVICNDTVYHGTFKAMDDRFLVLDSASLYVLGAEGEIEATYLYDRGVSIVKDKIIAVMDGEEREELGEG